MDITQAKQNKGKKVLIRETGERGIFTEGILELDPSGTAIKVCHVWHDIRDVELVSVLDGHSINESGNDGEQLING
jgi:hypothetical protein